METEPGTRVAQRGNLNARGVCRVLKIVMEDMDQGEVAALYQDGEDAVILVSRDLSDDVRVCAVNRLLATARALPAPTVRAVSSVAGLATLLFTHLGQQVASPAGQHLQSLII